MSAKAGKLAAGYSAVHDALEKGRVEMLLFAEDLSEGTKEKVMGSDYRITAAGQRCSPGMRLGQMLNRELVGVVGIQDKGLADAVWREAERLKGLINSSE